MLTIGITLWIQLWQILSAYSSHILLQRKILPQRKKMKRMAFKIISIVDSIKISWGECVLCIPGRAKPRVIISLDVPLEKFWDSLFFLAFFGRWDCSHPFLASNSPWFGSLFVSALVTLIISFSWLPSENNCFLFHNHEHQESKSHHEIRR